MPRIARVLSAAQVKELSRVEGEHSVGGEPGLFLRVRKSATGAFLCSWSLRRQGAGGFRVGLGNYPLVSLKAARDQAHDILLKMKSGIHPVEERRQQKAEAKAQRAAEKERAASMLTIADVFVEHLDWREGRGEWKHSADVRRREEQRFRKHILPLGGKIVISEATADQIAEVMRPIWIEKRSTADKVLTVLKHLFTWATTVKKIRSQALVNPASKDAIGPLLAAERIRPKRQRMPFLEPDQMPSFMAAVQRVDTVGARALVFSVLTCSRSRNVRLMRWDQVDMKSGIWTIDAVDMKVSANGQHIVPLSRQAMEILKTMESMREYLGCPYVFVGRDGRKGISEMTMNCVIRALHKEELLEGREGWIDREQSEAAGEPVLAVQHAISRASFETWAQSLRKDKRTIDLCLHHNVDTRLHSSYDRDKSIEQKRKLLQEWADFCLPE